MTGPLQHPTSELVFAAWVAKLTTIPAAMVATQPPQDVSQWTTFVPPGAAGAFLKVVQFVTGRVVGGSPQLEMPVQHPVFEVKCYATNPGSDKPPWFAANQTAELIRLATYNRTPGQFGAALAIGAGNTGYNGANVLQATMHSEPRRLNGDVRNYAIYQFDMGLAWREIGLLIP